MGEVNTLYWVMAGITLIVFCFGVFAVASRRRVLVYAAGGLMTVLVALNWTCYLAGWYTP